MGSTFQNIDLLYIKNLEWQIKFLGEEVIPWNHANYPLRIKELEKQLSQIDKNLKKPKKDDEKGGKFVEFFNSDSCYELIDLVDFINEESDLCRILNSPPATNEENAKNDFLLIKCEIEEMREKCERALNILINIDNS
jgi:hypothetical protein